MNMCATTSNAHGITPYQMWYRKSPPMNLLHPFGTVGYLRRIKRGHKLAPHGKTCLIMGIAQNYPRSTFRVLKSNTGEIAIRKNVSWQPETPEVRGDGHQTAASGGRSNTGGKQMPQPSPEVGMEVTTALPLTTQQTQRTMEPAEGPLELGVGDKSQPGHESESKGGDPE